MRITIHRRVIVASLIAAFTLPALPSFAARPDPLAKRPYQPGDRIAVIGAGVSGLAVVRSLIEKGVPAHKITVLEKNPVAGGKVESVEVDGYSYELGAVVMFPGRYQAIEALAEKYGVPTTPLARGTSYNLATGAAIPAPSAEALAAFQAQLANYFALHQTVFPHLTEPKGYSVIPPELDKSWPDFVRDNGLDLLPAFFGTILGGSGYVQFNDPPHAAQIARFFRPSLLSSVLTNGPRVFRDGGYQKVWLAEAADLAALGVTFRYGQTVTKLVRTPASTLVLLKGKLPSIMQVEHVFYTADLRWLPSLLAQPTEEEKATYARITSYDYRVYLARIHGLPDEHKNGASGIAPSMYVGTPLRPVLWVKMHDQTDVYMVYAYGAENVTDAEIQQNITADFATIGGTVETYLTSKRWSYFPHLRNDLEAFFNEVMSLEGAGGVWVVGEALSSAVSIEVYEQGKALAALFVDQQL